MLCLFCKEPIGELNLKRALDEDTGVMNFISKRFSKIGHFFTTKDQKSPSDASYWLMYPQSPHEGH